MKMRKKQMAEFRVELIEFLKKKIRDIKCLLSKLEEEKKESNDQEK